jgi:hypothetical protein
MYLFNRTELLFHVRVLHTTQYCTERTNGPSGSFRGLSSSGIVELLDTDRLNAVFTLI